MNHCTICLLTRQCGILSIIQSKKPWPMHIERYMLFYTRGKTLGVHNTGISPLMSQYPQVRNSREAASRSQACYWEEITPRQSQEASFWRTGTFRAYSSPCWHGAWARPLPESQDCLPSSARGVALPPASPSNPPSSHGSHLKKGKGSSTLYKWNILIFWKTPINLWGGPTDQRALQWPVLTISSEWS